MTLHLRTKLGIAAKVAVYGAGAEKTISEAKPLIKTNTIKEWEDNGVIFGHCLSYFRFGKRKFIVDEDGVTEFRNTLGSKVLLGYMEPEEMRVLAAQSAGWNTWFERENISKLENILDVSLGDYEL